MTTPAKPTVSVSARAMASSTDWMLSSPATTRVTSISAWRRRMELRSSVDTAHVIGTRGAVLQPGWPDRLPRFGDLGRTSGRPFVLREAPLAAPLRRFALPLLELATERAQQRPGDEERRDDQQRDAHGEVHVDAVRPAQVGIRRAEAQDGQHDPVQEEQPADDAADVEEGGGSLLARAPALLLGLLRLVDQLIAGACLACHGDFLPGSDEEQARDDGQAEHREGEHLRRPVPAGVGPPRGLLLC